jgi:hypothetical protein
MGSPKELGYVQQALQRDFDAAMTTQQQHHQQQHLPTLLVHSASCNAKNSLDGIEAGGRRLAQEVNEILQQLVQDEILSSLQQQQQKEKKKNDVPPSSTQQEQPPQQHVIALSFLGFSLGGMYSRYALPFIDWNIMAVDGMSIPVVPNLFVTAATPHLGVQRMTYWKLPACLEPLVAWYLGRTGQDLFRRPRRKHAATTSSYYDDIIQQMSLDATFLLPLSKFSKRMTIANAFSTDFAVHTATAAFLTDDDDDDVSWEEEDHHFHDHEQPNVSAHYFVETENSPTKTTNAEQSNLVKSKQQQQQEMPKNDDTTPHFPTAKFTTSRSWSYSEDSCNVSRQPSCDSCTSEPNNQHIQAEEENDDDDDEKPRHCQRPLIMERNVDGSLSDMATSLNSLGWTKVFVDVRPHIPALWVRPKATMKEIVSPSDYSQKSTVSSSTSTTTTTTRTSSKVFSPSTLKRRLSGKGFDFNTLPFGHSFLVASTKNWWYTWFYRNGRKFVDQVLAKELVEEMLLLDDDDDDDDDAAIPRKPGEDHEKVDK